MCGGSRDISTVILNIAVWFELMSQINSDWKVSPALGSKKYVFVENIYSLIRFRWKNIGKYNEIFSIFFGALVVALDMKAPEVTVLGMEIMGEKGLVVVNLVAA